MRALPSFLPVFIARIKYLHQDLIIAFDLSWVDKKDKRQKLQQTLKRLKAGETPGENQTIQYKAGWQMSMAAQTRMSEWGQAKQE